MVEWAAQQKASLECNACRSFTAFDPSRPSVQRHLGSHVEHKPFPSLTLAFPKHFPPRRCTPLDANSCSPSSTASGVPATHLSYA